MNKILGSLRGSQAGSLYGIEEGWEGEEGEEGGGGDGGGKGGKGDKPKVKEKFNLHPKVRVDLKIAREDIDFNIQLRVTEGVQIAGTQLDPICDIHCFGQVTMINNN